ncbi:NTP transferase domain-containing protein [Candidatus Micrarchaeota archaeon]|nr:NTP transferase domain-containing protein [Candidatus Micrarchaeota archaeon]
MKAVILAAGDGIRLRPFTETRPKVLLQVAGKPILYHLLAEAKKAGIKEAIIVVRHLKDQIIEYFSKTDLGLKITFVEQGKDNGTGAALICAEKYVKETFLVLAGDSVLEAGTIKSVIDGHKGKTTLALKKVKNPQDYGTASVSSGKITSFEEKSKKPKSDLANISVYCMEPTMFDEIKKIKKSPRGEYEVVDIFVGASAVVVNGYWKDIGYPWDLFDANEFLLSKMDTLHEHIENSTIDGKVIMEKGAKIINSYVEGYAYIGENTVIGPNAYLRGCNSIGKNCAIGSGTTVKSSILFDNVHAKHLTYIGDSVIGSNVNFGSGTQIANYRFDGKEIPVLTEKGWVNTGRKKLGVFVGDNTKFGVLSCTMPGKFIGTNCWIHSGIVVNKNVPSNTNVFTRQPIEFAKMGETQDE